MNTMMLLTVLALAGAQTTPSELHEMLTYPAPFEKIRKSLSKAQVDAMMTAAVTYCRSLPAAETEPRTGCTLMQASDILTADGDLHEFASFEPSQARSPRVQVCWRNYNAQRLKNVHPFAACLDRALQVAEAQQDRKDQAVIGAAIRSRPARSSYCDNVFRVSGGSYAVLEECEKSEAAARARLGR